MRNVTRGVPSNEPFKVAAKHARTDALADRRDHARLFGWLTLIGLLCLAIPQGYGEEDASADLAAKLQNPISSLISLPLQFNYDTGAGLNDDGYLYNVKIQPVIPFSISDEWNMVSRTIIPVTIYQEDVLGPTKQAGLGDTVQSLFFTPKEPGIGGIVWGVGPVFQLPTATDEFLGSEKFGLGATALVLKQTHGWTFGALLNHVWSVAGDEDREDISASYVQPFVSYTTKTKTTIGFNAESTYNWKDHQWTVPLNLTVSQLLMLGRQPISLQLGGRYYADGPKGTPEWGLRLGITLLFPQKPKK